VFVVMFAQQCKFRGQVTDELLMRFPTRAVTE
jgi:hypothetical protein